MQDLAAKREKLLVEAADCELIANLATDPKKRRMFARLSRQLKQPAEEIAAEIAARDAQDAA